jgi:hypothetical protein
MCGGAAAELTDWLMFAPPRVQKSEVELSPFWRFSFDWLHLVGCHYFDRPWIP